MKEDKNGRVDVVQWVKENAERLRELRWLYRMSGMPGKRPLKAMNMDDGADVGCVFLVLPKGIYYGLCIELVQEGDGHKPSRFLGRMEEAGIFTARLSPSSAVEALREYCELRPGAFMPARERVG